MQKVEGSSPFIRFVEPAGNGRFLADAFRFTNAKNEERELEAGELN
jgi:hypothetical protein